jgi:hypothetical protein
MEDMQTFDGGEDPIKGATKSTKETATTSKDDGVRVTSMMGGHIYVEKNQKKDETPLYEVNNKYLQNQYKAYNEDLSNYVVQAFQLSQGLPKIKGKPIENLDQIPALIEKYGDQLYEQAKMAATNPDIDDDQAVELLKLQKRVDDDFGYIAEANKIMFGDIKNAAINVDAKMKVNGWHKLLLTDDGQFKNRNQAIKDIKQYQANLINTELEEWRKKNPKPLGGSLFMQRTDMPNPMAGKWAQEAKPGQRVKTPYGVVVTPSSSGKTIPLDSRPKMQNSEEGYGMLEQAQYQILANKYKNLNYDDVLRRVFEEYNKNPKTRKIKAAAEGLMDNNAGGIKTTVSKQQYKFDMDDAFDDDNQVKEEMKNTINLLKVITSSDDVLFAQGELDETNVEIPSETDEASKNMVKVIWQDLQDDIVNTDRKKNSDKRVTGDISFVPISGGDENYHAYHIKMRSSYFDRHLGTKDNPDIARDSDGKNHKFVRSGITIYVPKNVSGTTTIGKQSMKGTSISPVEGMINLSGNGTFSRTIPSSMTYNIVLDKKKGEYVVTGNGVAYNLETAKMDTFDIKDLPGVKNRHDLSVDLDQLDIDLYKKALENFRINRQLIREHSQLKGVRDPKQLSGN